MRPEECKNCCAKEFIEYDDAYVCAYCDTRYRKIAPKPVPVTVPRYNSTPAPVQGSAQIKPKRQKNKWAALLLCFFLGVYGAHKFYEGRIGMGFLYLFTAGLFGFGWLVDIFILLFKPNPYYV